jgi:hypothetical protein
MDKTESYFRGRYFGLEVQHQIPLDIRNNVDAEDARSILTSIGFNLEANANKKLVFINPAMRDAILAAPAAVQNVFRNSGIGFNIHDSKLGNHPGYSSFVLTALNQLGKDADAFGWNTTARERAVFDFLRFVDGITADGNPPIYGTAEADFTNQWNVHKQLDYSNISDNTTAASDIDQFRANANLNVTDDGSQFNSEFRYAEIQKLLANAATVLPAEDMQKALADFSKASAAGGNSGHATAAAIAVLVKLNERSSAPISSLDALAEQLAAEAYQFFVEQSGKVVVAVEEGANLLQSVYDTMSGLLNKISGLVD